MGDPESSWTEESSRLYRQIAAVAVPRRTEQIAALISLLPFSRDASFTAVELACGEGFLAAALLSFFPQASYVGLDRSSSMLQETSQRLRPFATRRRDCQFALRSSP